MSVIEYNNLLFEISQRLEELNVLNRLLFMCRGMLASGSEDNIQDGLSLFKELEEQNSLGINRMDVIKGLLKSFKEWSFFGRVKDFERKRKKYNGLLEQIILALDELNELERLIAMCRGKISQESEAQIRDVRSLFKELEKQNNLEYDRLDILKGILIETGKNDLLRELEEFEERRNQDDELKRQEDEFERRTAQATAVASSIGNTFIGVLNIKTVSKVVAGGIVVVSTVQLLRRWTTFDQLVTAVNTCVLPAGISLVNITDGSVCLTVQAESLSALTTLWNLYKDGTLERRLYNFFVTDEVKECAGGETIELIVSIEEEEYDKACRELISEARETARIGDGARLRRNSDSAVCFRPKEETPLLKIISERIAVLETKIAQLPPEILEDFSPGETATKFWRQQESWKALEAGGINEGTDGLEISQRRKPKVMDPRKLAFVQKYLEDVQDTRSMTTELTDSGLATHTAASELGAEEINESSKLRLKDLSDDVTRKLSEMLHANEAALEKFYQFFGLKTRGRYPLEEIKRMFPDTAVGVLKECFEALRLYDLVEIMEKVRPRSLRPAVSPEQIEKLRRADDRPTKYHSDVAVLVVSLTVEEDNVEREHAGKIETFFKDLNSRNEVALISLGISQKTREVLGEIEKRNRGARYDFLEGGYTIDLEYTLRRMESLEKELEEVMQMEKGDKQRQNDLKLKLSQLKEEKLWYISKLENVEKEIEQAKKDFEELEKESITKPISRAMDEWIQNQEKFTCVAVFIISNVELYSEAVLEECVVEKLALIPDHTKIVFSPYGWKSVDKIPETLHVSHYSHWALPFFTRMIEIFNKRWQTLDLISMIQELQRATFKDEIRMYFGNTIFIKDSLSTLPTFQKKEEDHSS